VFITGGCGGIGLAVGRRFALMGKRVVLLDIDIGKGEALSRQQPRVQRVRVDLADPVEVAECLQRLASENIAPDVLVNCVGISPKLDSEGNRLKLWTTTVDQWRRVFDVNVTSYFVCQRELIPGMIERGYGRIINIGSYAARTGGYQGAAHYQTAKNAILGMTRAVAREVARHGITVNTVNPGRIATQMTRDVPDSVNEAFISSIPLGRLGEPDDVAKVVVFLASDLADYITGAAIEVNGGVFMGP
jgi:NAD(P)-dependent dehydrogenase (short-subunit alcohol dehydrogenase family)